MYKIGDYIFDSERLLVYNNGIHHNTLNAVIDAMCEKENAMPELLRHDPDKMHADKVTTNLAGICLTYNCNLRCNYCGYSSANSDDNKLQISDVEAFIKDIIKKRAIRKYLFKEEIPLDIYFTGGGEPTFDWKLFEKSVLLIERMCAERTIPLRLGLTTNGMLSDNHINFIVQHFDNVMVSYDGLPEVQNRNRRTPESNDTNVFVEHTIQQFAKADIFLTVRSTIWKNDYHKIEKMYDYISSIIQDWHNVTWSVHPTMYEGRALDQICMEDDKSYKDFLRYYVNLIEKIIAKEGYTSIKNVDMSIFYDTECDVFCSAHSVSRPWLLPDGSIVTCIESKEYKTYIGKIKEGTLKYYDEYSDELLKMTQKKYSECQECIAYPFCKGGCPIWHLRVQNDLEIPECSLQKEFWRYVIEAALVGKYSFGWRLEKINVTHTETDGIYKLVHKPSETP